MLEGSPELEPGFRLALASVPASAWARWFGDESEGADPRLDIRQTLVAAFVLPGSAGQAAICVFECHQNTGAVVLRQAVVKHWLSDPPAQAQLLNRASDPDGNTRGALASAWADPHLRSWLSEALSAGASLRSDGWEWLATPERAAAGRNLDGSSEQLDGRRHDIVLLPPGAVAVVYRRLTRGGQPELDLLRHLERVPGLRLAPIVLGAAIIRSPTGERSASAILEGIDPAAATMHAVLLARLARAFVGDQARMTASIEDVRALGTITRELHAALGRPFGEGMLAGAVAATPADLEVWVARSRSAITRAMGAYRAALLGESPALESALARLPDKLQDFAVAASAAPGLVHRIHGNLRLDNVLIAPPRRLTIVEFDGDALLDDRARLEPQSPWRDVAHLLVSLTEVAVDAAGLVGGEPEAVEFARLWEREARKAYLEGYGSGGGALHALIAIFEMELAALQLSSAIAGAGGSLAVASHTLQRLSRTVG